MFSQSKLYSKMIQGNTWNSNTYEQQQQNTQMQYVSLLSRVLCKMDHIVSILYQNVFLINSHTLMDVALEFMPLTVLIPYKKCGDRWRITFIQYISES